MYGKLIPFITDLEALNEAQLLSCKYGQPGPGIEASRTGPAHKLVLKAQSDPIACKTKVLGRARPG
ncbi:hypothetical protein PanWU01x14_272740 [Parasponia andersonii]|uniref:Uncharacterized protein n=1 Tax=Parasponia andersonii TaxID=3476 RepID=A0A2P5B494_PARAD|nr:hypothetical protein PanWU01x14_272740 [Parasponia andersonii]